MSKQKQNPQPFTGSEIVPLGWSNGNLMTLFEWRDMCVRVALDQGRIHGLENAAAYLEQRAATAFLANNDERARVLRELADDVKSANFLRRPDFHNHLAAKGAQ